MTGPLLTLLDAPRLAAYTATGWWGSETLYTLALRHSARHPTPSRSATGIAG